MEIKTAQLVREIEAKRIKDDITREELARRCDVSSSQIKRVFEFKSKSSFDLIVKMCEALDLEIIIKIK